MKSTGHDPRILVQDVQPVWIRAVEDIFAGEGFSTTSTNSHEEALEMIEAERFDVVMIGLDSSGVELDWTTYVARIKAIEPSIKVILVSLDEDPALIQRASENGVDAYVLKRAQPADLIYAIHQVLEPDVYPVSPFGPAKGEATDVDTKGLTPREREILGLIAEGKSNAEVARALAISETTVKGHLWRLYRKIGVSNRTAAARWVVGDASSEAETGRHA